MKKTTRGLVFADEVNKIARIIFTAVSATVALIVLGIDRNVEYVGMNSATYASNVVLLILALAVLYSLVNICGDKIKDIINKRYDMVVSFILLLTVLLQIYIVSNAAFRTGWDCGTVIEIAERVASNQDVDGFLNFYYSTYPNNRLLIYVFSKVIFFIKNSNIVPIDYYFVLIGLNVLLVDIAGLLLLLTTQKLFGKNTAVFSLIIFSSLIGCSPWIIVPYTDTMAMPFVIGTLCSYVYQHKSKVKVLLYIRTAIIAFIGAMIKPTVIIIYIAIAIAQICKFLSKEEDRFRILFYFVIATIAAFSLCGLMEKMYIKENGIEIDENRELSVFHYAMMGVNESSDGGFNSEDVEMSFSIEEKKAREETNRRVTVDRVKELGLVGISKLYLRKTLSNFNDGTFAWGREGEFYQDMYFGDSGNGIGDWIYNYGKNFAYYSTTLQMIWLVIIAALPFWGIRYSRKLKNDDELVILLSLVGITLFLTLFEARARYLICYLPIYCLVCSACVSKIARKCQYRRKV